MVTASERRLKPLGIQPGNREWVTLIAGINAKGWTIPPFFIFKAMNHDRSWLPDLGKDWRIGLSNNGWTTNELGIAWLQHFIQHTEGRRVGSHVLLIIDGHESHKSLAFQDLCEKNKIITLCMPPHASHILQPLDVGCFSPLKRAYSREIRVLADSYVEHIDKKAFLASFKQVFKSSFSKENILSSFRATGLVPHCPEVVRMMRALGAMAGNIFSSQSHLTHRGSFAVPTFLHQLSSGCAPMPWTATMSMMSAASAGASRSTLSPM